MAPGNAGTSRGLLFIFLVSLGLFVYVWPSLWKASNKHRVQESSPPPYGHGAPADEICDPDRPVKKVAVVGAGSGGASTAYFLSQFKSPCQRVNVTIYERNDYVGGRSTTVHVYGDPKIPVELGASIFVEVNHNLVNATRAMGLTLQDYGSEELVGLSRSLGVWDGESIVFSQSDNSYDWWNTLKILWKYSMSPIRTNNLMKQTVGKFLKLYDVEFPFESLTDVADAVGLGEVISVNGADLLLRNSISSDFARDIIQASTRVNYAQNLDQIHALETMVCMATDGAMSVKGGNWQIFDGMVKASGAGLVLNTTVELISKGDTRYSIKAHSGYAGIEGTGGTSYNDDYDEVVMAAPLHLSIVTISPSPVDMPKAVPYVDLHVTLFTSPYRLNPLAFNLPKESQVPSTLLTTMPSSGSKLNLPPFFSISTLRSVINKNAEPSRTEHVYKMFSPTAASDEYIKSLLDTERHPRLNDQEVISWKYMKIWQSYPYLPPTTKFDKLRLDGEDGMLWYTSGIERFISTMETSSLMGMNVAKLISQRWEEGSLANEKKEDIDTNPLPEL